MTTRDADLEVAAKDAEAARAVVEAFLPRPHDSDYYADGDEREETCLQAVERLKAYALAGTVEQLRAEGQRDAANRQLDALRAVTYAAPDVVGLLTPRGVNHYLQRLLVRGDTYRRRAFAVLVSVRTERKIAKVMEVRALSSIDAAREARVEAIVDLGWERSRGDTYRKRAFAVLESLRVERQRRKSDNLFSTWITNQLSAATQALSLPSTTTLPDLAASMVRALEELDELRAELTALEDWALDSLADRADWIAVKAQNAKASAAKKGG